MIKNAVLPPEARPVPTVPEPVRGGGVPAEVDVIRALAEAVSRPGNALALPPGVRSPRPFDAQYWACWVVTALVPVLLAVLWIAR